MNDQPIALIRLGRPTKVGTIAHVHPVAQRHFKRAQTRGQHLGVLLGILVGPAEPQAIFRIGFICDERRDKMGAALSHQARCFIGQKIAVFDTSYTAGYGPSYANVAVDMGQNIAAAAIGLVGNRFDLRQRILRVDQLVARRTHSTTCHDLDLVDALTDVFAHRFAHFVNAVRDDRHTAYLR